jgi:hypothetical protein
MTAGHRVLGHAGPAGELAPVRGVDIGRGDLVGHERVDAPVGDTADGRAGAGGASVGHTAATGSRFVAVTAPGSATLRACDAPASSRVVLAPDLSAMN